MDKSDKNFIIRTITRAKKDITLMVKRSIHQKDIKTKLQNKNRRKKRKGEIVK